MLYKDGDGLSDWFQVLTGVRQGCILSPLLFAVTINWVMKQATGNKDIDWVEDQKLSEVDFADDIAALSNNTQDLQEFVNAIGQTAGGLGLVISNKKTKNMLAGERLHWSRED